MGVLLFSGENYTGELLNDRKERERYQSMFFHEKSFIVHFCPDGFKMTCENLKNLVSVQL